MIDKRTSLERCHECRERIATWAGVDSERWMWALSARGVGKAVWKGCRSGSRRLLSRRPLGFKNRRGALLGQVAENGVGPVSCDDRAADSRATFAPGRGTKVVACGAEGVTQFVLTSVGALDNFLGRQAAFSIAGLGSRPFGYAFALPRRERLLDSRAVCRCRFGASFLVSLIWLLWAGGCALWEAETEPAPALPPSRLSADSVVLEIAFVKLPAEPTASDSDTATLPNKSNGDWWAFADEQQFPVEVRAALGKNGIRCGVLGEHLPDELRALLPTESETTESDPNVALERVIAEGATGQRLPCRAGRRAEIQLGKSEVRRVMLWSEGDQACGETFENSQCLLAATTWPRGDGRVKLSLVPELKHGEVRNRYVGQEGRFLIEAGQEQKVFNSLRLDCELAPGETLAIAATPELKSLGSQFFADAASGERRLVLIRLALTQDDGLFAAEASAPRLVTPLE